MTNATPTAGQVKVHAVRIIGTRLVVYSAYEYGDGTTRTHSTVQNFNGRYWGRIGCASLPAELDALPARSDERWAAVRTWQASEYERAYAAIVATFPAAADGRRSMGDITVEVPA